MAKTTYINRTWVQGRTLSLPLPGPQPFNQNDWPNPYRQYLPLPPNTGFALGENRNLLSGETAPFYQTDWPLPPLKAAASHVGYSQPVDTSLLGGGIPPVAQSVWGYASGRQILLAEMFPATPGAGQPPTPVPGPFPLFDWPNPHWSLRPPPHVGWTWVQDLALTTVVSTPFYQTDWPVPKGQPPRQDWIKATVLELYGSGLAPFFETDWPNPRGYPPPHQTWFEGIPLNLYGAGIEPHYQTDWPNPVLAKRSYPPGGEPFSLLQNTMTPVVISNNTGPDRLSIPIGIGF